MVTRSRPWCRCSIKENDRGWSLGQWPERGSLRSLSWARSQPTLHPEVAQGGRAVDGTETGWGRPAEPAPRWRALLDRARHGARSAEESPAEPEPPQAPQQQYGQPLPTRPVGPDRRPVNPLDPRAADDRPRYEQPAPPPGPR